MSKTSLDCISNLENHVHEEFASLRFSGRDFAYSGPKDIFSRIDTYCDDLAIEECRTPLMIVGTSGVGKSALLANWMHRRISKASRIRSGDEYIFWHAVGCSRQSLNVNHMLRRLMAGLKTFFDLEQKQLPVSQDKLSWELPRFLELASKKGKVIILIDGLHRLRNSEDQEDRLSWLPLELPSNVKVMMTVTSNVANTSTINVPVTPKKNAKGRILMELERRGVPCLRMPNLDSELCRKLIDSYLRNHTSIDETSKVSGLNALDDIRNSLLSGTANPIGSAGNSNILKGFLLFETQISQLVAHPLGGNPQFLRLFLRCLDFVCHRGYSIWMVFNNWIQATSVSDLVTRILETCEQGHVKTRESSQWACDQTLKAGGLKNLKTQYPWHPQLADREETNEKGNEDRTEGAHSQQQRHTHTSHNHELTQPSTHSATTTNKFGKKEAFQIRANIENGSNQALAQAVESAAQLAIIDPTETGFNPTNDQLIHSIILRIPENRGDNAHGMTTGDAGDGNISARENGSAIVEGSRDVFDIISAMSSSDEESDCEHDEQQPSQQQHNQANNNHINSSNPANTTPHATGKKRAPHGGTGAGFDSNGSPRQSGTSTPNHHSGARSSSHGHRHGGNSHSAQKSQPQPTVAHLASNATDPGDGFFSLPLYMRGGVNCPGLGDVLGSSLSLLLVCRHGLKEKELWAILNDLQVLLKAKKLNVERKREKEHEEHLRSSLQGIVSNQGSLERVLKSEDIQKRCFLSKDMLFRCVNKFVKLNNADFELLLTYIFKEEIKKEYGLNPTASTSELDFDEIDYEFFIINAVKLNRKWRDNHAYRGHAQRKDDVFLENGEDDEDFDDFLLQSSNNNLQKGNAKSGTRKSFSSTAKKHDNQTDALGPVVEELLLQILCAIGVLYIPEHKVLVLPSDSEPFREAIQSKYIASSGENSLLYWHNLIVKHFVSQPNSLRKCEELPWHLKICRKWNLLKESLVDLTTFDLMFQNDLRDELTDYWLLLTEGPLPVGNEHLVMNVAITPHAGHAQVVTGGANTMNNGTSSDAEGKDNDGQTTYSALLREIDEAIALKQPLKEIRRKHKENEMQVFDVVEELNRSVESWVAKSHPTPQEIHDMIKRLGNFLLFFSRRTVQCPQYRRTGMELTHLAEFKILNDVVESFAPNIPPLFEEYYELITRGEDGKKLPAGLEKGVESNTDSFSGGTSSKRYFDRVSRTEKRAFPPKGFDTTRFYLFLRWVWVQLPWLALYPAANLFKTGQRGNPDHEMCTVVAGGKGSGIGDSADHNHSPGHHNASANTATTTGNPNSNNKSSSSSVSSDSDRPTIAAPGLGSDPSKHLLRVWNAKKADPTIQVFQKSLNRKLAAIKPHSSVSSSMERNVDVSYNKLYEELLQPSHVAQVRLGLGNGPRDKFRRTLEQEIESNKNIPFSYHGVKTMKTGSLFPSYSALIKEKNQKKVDAEILLKEEAQDETQSLGSMSKHSLSKVKKKGLNKFNLGAALKQGLTANASPVNFESSTFFLTEVDDEIKRMNSEEYLSKHQLDGSALIKDEVDLEYGTLLERIARMKTICNKLLIIEREKERNILELEKQIILREESDTHMINEVQSAEILLHSLHERNVVMEKSLQEALELQQGYVELIATLKANPPYVESQVKALEVENELADKQFQDLCQHRAKLQEDVKRLEGNRKQQLIERINYFRNARTEIAVKKKQVNRELRHLRETLGLRKARAKKLERRNARKAKNKSGKGKDNDGRPPSKRRESDYSSDDSDDSKGSNEDIPLNPQVIHFINALVRKSNYNEPIIMEGDSTIDDIKRRAAENEAQWAARRGLNSTSLVTNSTVSSSPPPTAPVHSPNSPHSSHEHSHGHNANKRKTNVLLANVEARMAASNAQQLHQQQHHQNPSAASAHASTNSHPVMVNTNINNRAGNTSIISPNSVALMAHSKGYVSQKTVLVNRRGRKHSQEQLSFLRSLYPTISGDEKNLMQQLRQAFALLFEKTEFTSIDTFLERYQQDQQMLENLRAQQSLADARLAQLKQEHTALMDDWNDITFSSSDANSHSNNLNDSAHASDEKQISEGDDEVQESKNKNSSSSTHANDGATKDGNPLTNSSKKAKTNKIQSQFEDYGRFLDNQLFAKEVQLHHVQRIYDHDVHLMSEIRNAVGHIMSQLTTNNKLLAGLSRHQAPNLRSDTDLLQCVSWCEDMIIALNEALTMDAANRPNAGGNPEDTKSIAERQMELAGLVHDMHYGKRRNQKYRNSNSAGENKKELGGLSKVLIASNDSFVTSPRNVLVTPVSKVDKAYDSKMTKYLAERDRRSGLTGVKDDENVLYPGEKDSRAESKRYLSALDAKSLARAQHLKLVSHSQSQNNPSAPDAWTKDIAQRFLQEGLDRDHTRSLSRKAKLLVGHTKGPVAGYGMVLEELMKSHGQTFAFPIAKSPTKMDRLALLPHHGHPNTAGTGPGAAIGSASGNGEGLTGAEPDSPRDGISLGNQSS